MIQPRQGPLVSVQFGEYEIGTETLENQLHVHTTRATPPHAPPTQKLNEDMRHVIQTMRRMWDA